MDASRSGIVYLVGAGPGDPELLTMRAAKLLSAAEFVVYDHLVSDGVLDFIPRDAVRIYAGKQNRRHAMEQDEINALLIRLARAGNAVVRLKGGDPFIFGRGGEEVESLVAAGVRYEVVPGVSAANGVACYTGIPLTHRDYAQSCIFTTGHLKDGSLDLDWALLAQPRQTVVIYMGLGALAEICRQLVAHGHPADLPAAVVERGTTEHQRVVTGTLGTIPALAVAANLGSPCLIIVGEVVRLHRTLDWFNGVAAEEIRAAAA